jgi:hypothetical protein
MTHDESACRRRVLPWSRVLALGVCVTALAFAVPVESRTQSAATIASMTAGAARVFRGRCVGIQAGSVALAGARVPVTTYTFRIGEHLKGARTRTVRFRQLGASGGGARDLGRLAGLPAYAVGGEYVLFLLPPSRAGLTSPAGAAEGAFVVRGDQVRRLVAMPGARSAARSRASSADAAISSYQELRHAVLAALGR